MRFLNLALPCLLVTAQAVMGQGTQPVVAIHDSELTRALETMPAANATPRGAGTTGNEWWTANWHYFVMPEAAKEALRSDGTAFTVVGDANITAGILLTNGAPRYPIVISLASEAIRDDEIAPLTNYVAAGGFLLVGSSAFTRNTNGTTRGNFAFANELGVNMVVPGLTNWWVNVTFSKQGDHRLTGHIPYGNLIWGLPSDAEEICWGTSPTHAYLPPHLVWQVQASNATVVARGDIYPCLTVKQFGKGYFIYYANQQPLITHGGWSPRMYTYLIFRKAIEWAFESAKLPVAKLSPWPYTYDAAFMVRHDLENFTNEIAGILSSAQFESTNGAKGDYYFCAGTLREDASPAYNTNTIVANLRQAVTSFGATIQPHNGGLKNPLNPSLVHSNYDYWHWGPDEALDTIPAGYASGKSYAQASLSNAFSNFESWLSGVTNGIRSWVAPYFNATREDSYDLQSQLNVKIAGDQKLTPFPHWTVSTRTSGKRYGILSEPVCDWYASSNIVQDLEPWHPPFLYNTVTLHDAVDFYYGLGALINIYSHTLSTGFGDAGPLAPEYITYSLNTNLHPRVWSANGVSIYQWWLQRSNAQISVSYSTNGYQGSATITVAKATHTNTAVEILVPGSGTAFGLQVFTNGVLTDTSRYRTNGQLVRVLVGTSVTNANIRYVLGPKAQDDLYNATNGAMLNVAAPGVLGNDSAGLEPDLSANVVSGPAYGLLTLNTNGGFSYLPDANFVGTDSFTYQASDGGTNSSTATVTIVVSQPNTLFLDSFARASDPGPPSPWTIQEGTWTVTKGILKGSPTTLNSYSVASLSNNWTDYAVQARLQFSAGAFGGGLSGRLNSSNGARYAAWVYPGGSTGGSNVVGLIKFTSWHTFGYTNTADGFIQKANLPDVGTNWHTLKLAFLGNRIAVYFDNTQVISVADAETQTYTNGGVSLDMYTASTAYTLLADDLTVSPLVAADGYVVGQDVPLTLPTPGVLGNDTGVYSTNLTAAWLSGPSHGTLLLSTDGGFTYTPATNYVGSDSFVYEADDGTNNLGTAQVSLTVIPTNHVPVPPQQTNRTVVGQTAVVVTNTATDSDLPAQTLTYQLLSFPAGAGISSDGVISWTPAANQVPSTNLFTTRVTDDGVPGLSATNSFTVFVISPPVVVLAATNLALENCVPTNGVIDPGETVTMLFGLRNTGGIDTANLLATLLATNGVAAPSGPQSYGVLVAGGSTVVQPFTFTANGVCQSNITAVLQLQDGAMNLGTVSASYQLGHTVVLLTQSFDTVTSPALPSGWTSSATNAAAKWFTTNSLFDTAPNAAFSADAANVGDNQLVSPPILLPASPAQLTFKNRYSLECNTSPPTDGWDAGVLEISIGGAAFIDITNAGGVFLSGGYNAKVSTLYSNPLAGRGAWSGTTAGYVATAVSLPPAAAGQSIQLRWRCGTDTGGTSGSGWRIDSLSISAWACCAATAPALPVQTNRTVNELATLTVTNTAFDFGSPPEVLSYSLTVAPTNASISTNGIITWTPTQEQSPSTNIFTTVVTDNGSTPLSATNSFTVFVREVNVAPSLPVLPGVTINELALLTVTNTATNANIHSTITGYTLVNPPSGASISPDGIITWTPSQTQSPSTNTFNAIVTNANPYDLVNPTLTATNSFTVVVREVNVAPALPVLADLTVDELTLLTVTNTASNANIHSTITGYSLAVSPAGATIDATGIITWTPAQTQSPSTNTFTTVVTNGNPYDPISPSLTATNSFAVIVREVNVPPTLPTMSDLTVTDLTFLTLTNTATNANIHSTISGYVLLNPPAGATINSNGIITWTPSFTQHPGSNLVTTVVSNTNPYDLIQPHLSATNSFIVVVSAGAGVPPPVIQSINAVDGTLTITWSSVTGHIYRLQYKVPQLSTDWNDIPPDITATDSTITVTNAVEPPPLRFYRVMLLP